MIFQPDKPQSQIAVGILHHKLAHAFEFLVRHGVLCAPVGNIAHTPVPMILAFGTISFRTASK